MEHLYTDSESNSAVSFQSAFKAKFQRAGSSDKVKMTWKDFVLKGYADQEVCKETIN
jgi:hypothetical protein